MLSNTLSRRIEWGDCDPAGIVFNPRFFAFFDHCTTMLYEAAGWPKQVMVEKFDIAGCPLVETRAKFMAPCSYGDEVSITSSIAEIRNSSFDIRHELSKGGRLCVEGFETRVWTRKDPESGRLRSAPMPPEVVSRFRGE
jgi:4-hydroxybenzoyl-CoA thioesterase